MEIVVSKDAKTLTVDGVDYNLTYKPSTGTLVYVYASRTVYDKHTVGFWLFKKEIIRKRIEYPPKIMLNSVFPGPGEIVSFLQSSLADHVKDGTLADNIQHQLKARVEMKTIISEKESEFGDLLNQLNGSGSVKEKIEKELGL